MTWAVLNTHGECVSVADDEGEATERADRFNIEYPDEAPFVTERTESYRQAISVMRSQAQARSSRRRVTSADLNDGIGPSPDPEIASR